MTHKTVTVSISREPDPGNAINMGRVGLRERLLTWLFGPMRDVTVLVPGREVRDVTLRRVDEASCCGAECSDKELMALADAVKRHPAGSKLQRTGGEAA